LSSNGGDFGEVAGPSNGPREVILALFQVDLDHGILKSSNYNEDGVAGD
jgi:hypothetical protein